MDPFSCGDWEGPQQVYASFGKRSGVHYLGLDLPVLVQCLVQNCNMSRIYVLVS